MDVVTVESCLIIIAYGLSCMEFYKEIIKNYSFMKNAKIHDDS
jgi:hypothetical protein